MTSSSHQPSWPNLAYSLGSKEIQDQALRGYQKGHFLFHGDAADPDEWYGENGPKMCFLRWNLVGEDVLS